ncbi:MAG: hypothetical protein ABIC19_01105 [Patescibacteria group bacterium]|nr:hypothetical protein [Patescibacteria group bacterium]
MKKFLLLFLGLGIIGFLAISLGLKSIHRWGGNDRPQKIDEKFLDQKREELKKLADTQEMNKQEFCGSEFMPFIPGANWRYNISDGERTNILELKIPEPENGSQIIKAVFLDQSWDFETRASCANGGGVILDRLTMFRALDKKGQIITPVSANGFLIPANIEEITSWNFEVETKNEIPDENDPAKIKGAYREKANGILNVWGEEKIQTIMGEIIAKKIESKWVLTIICADMDDLEGENNCREDRWTANLVFWVAKKTGIIRAVYSQKDKKPMVLEIRSYQLPAADQ